MPEEAATQNGRCRGYTWSESAHEVEVRVPLPVGTKRNQLSITLHDDASGVNLWRTEIETAGGKERPQLPVNWNSRSRPDVRMASGPTSAPLGALPPVSDVHPNRAGHACGRGRRRGTRGRGSRGFWKRQ